MTPDVPEQPVELVAATVRTWIAEIRATVGAHAQAAITPSAFDLAQAIAQLRRRFEPLLDVAGTQLLKKAAAARCVDTMLGQVNALKDALRELERWATAGTRDVAQLRARGGPTVPFLSAVDAAERALQDLQALASALEASSGNPESVAPRRPLTDVQKRVWDALAGTCLPAKGVAGVPDMFASEEAVRKRVAEMRDAGFNIKHRPGRGYYRPDAPPPDIQRP